MLKRSAYVYLFDLVASAAAWTLGFLLRFNFEWPSGYLLKFTVGLMVLVAVQAAACRWAGLYRGMWVFASLPDLKRVLKAVSVSTVAVLMVLAVDRSLPNIPRSMAVLYPLCLLVFMGGGRAAWRMWKEHRLYGGLKGAGKPVVIVGAGSGGAMLVRELERSPDWRVVALVDDDRGKHGRELLGKPVAGSIDSLPNVLDTFRAQHVILAMPSAARQSLSKAADLAVRSGAHTYTVPGLEDIMGGKVAINAMRPLEIEDLLGREAVTIECENVRAMVAGKTVMVTGAGGSIGSELCRQLMRFGPGRLVLLDACEFVLYRIEQELNAVPRQMEILPLVGDVKDAARMQEIFERWRPDLVFHAAAYKHVPLMEVGNAWQAVRNNVFGTLVLAQQAQRAGVERFVLVSTDKAVNPTNVMGATKRLAEMICEALHMQGGATRFGMVRFGNVLGSTGSVIPKFQEQIARGGPVTVTHPDINRFFMSIPEAAQLLLQAASMGRGGEVFVMDMGEPVKIVDLARNMIRLSGYADDEIRIEFTGLRPGEKLFEELLADAEVTRKTTHPKLRIARSRPVDTGFLSALSAWVQQTELADDDQVREELHRWVPEYVSVPGKLGLTLVHDVDAAVKRAS